MKREILGIIPARGGSKSVPRKNIKMLHGRPLLAWTIEEAKKSKYITRTIVSTDDEEIAGVARKYGAEVPFMRPKEISGDLARDIEFLTHTLNFLKDNENYEPEIVLTLRVTDPLKTFKNIDEGIETLLHNEEADAVRPIIKAGSHPYKMWSISDDKKWLEPFLPKSFTNMDEPYNGPRQVLPEVYSHTGSMDIMRTETITKLKSNSGNKLGYFFMKPEESVNIDNPIDFKIAEILMAEREKNN